MKPVKLQGCDQYTHIHTHSRYIHKLYMYMYMYVGYKAYQFLWLNFMVFQSVEHSNSGTPTGLNE